MNGMSDRFLYKAKRKDNGEWVKGYYSVTPKGRCHICNKCVNPPDSDPMWQGVLITYEVDPSTVCQCTGIKDKNGKLIWENDILSAHFDSNYPDDVTYAKVAWKENGFRAIENESVDFPYLLKEDCAEYWENVGTFFDNPELLEQEENDEN